MTIGLGGAAWAGETKDANNIKVDIHHFMLTNQNGNLMVREVLKFNNTGKDTFIGTGEKVDGKNAVLTISLPAGYSNLAVEGLAADNFVKKDTAMITTVPLAPGTLEVSLTYNLAPTNGEFSIPGVINYPTNTMYVLSPAQGLVITPKKLLQSAGIQDFEGNKYQVLMAQNLTKGAQVEIGAKPGNVEGGGNVVDSSYNPSKVGFHSPGHLQRWYNSPLRNQNPHVWTAFFVILVISVIVAAGILVRNRQKAAAEDEEARKLDKLFVDLVAKQKRLMGKIAELEDKLAKGEIEQEEYNDLRNQYKKMLVKVKVKLKEIEELDEI